MLKEAEGDEREQRVMMEAVPRAAREVTVAERLFEVSVGLLARPSLLDDASGPL